MANDNQTQPKSGKPRRKLDIWNKIAVTILTLFLVGCVSVFFILVNIINDPEGMRFSRDGLSTLSNSRIFDSSGNMIFEFGEEIREDITYEQLPQNVVDAFLSIEDSRYFAHSGFDLPRFMAAAISNIRSGNLAQGGSTLTMQMIDNAFTKNQEAKMEAEGGTISKLDSIKLKIQEIYLALIAEQSIDKEDIMEYYLNRIWFGSSGNTRGIQKAAKYYFNKDVSELNLNEAAFLAGTVNAPGTYNPLNNTTKSPDNTFDYYQAAVDRRNTTLDLMLQHGYITQEEHDLAVNSDLSFALDFVQTVSTDPNEAYIDQVISEAINLTGQDPTVIPMDIYTALNTDIQAEVDRVMNGEVIPYPNDAFDVGMAIMDNTTGEIIAVGPGRNYHNNDNSVKQDNSINTQQPGSAMKPLLAYCSAFDLLGWSTNHMVNDKADDYWHAGFNLRNSDGKYEGNITLAYALGVSKNTTAAATMVEMVDQTGLGYWIDFCRKLGFDEEVCEMFTPQYCIGGGDMYASPIQMASAYTTFANQGTRINAHRIRRIIRRSDQEEINGNSTENEIVSTQAAWMMSDLLEKVVSGGYQNYNNILYNPNYPVYAKSGTSDWGDYGLQYGIPQGVIRDEWSIAYTSAFSIATWSGYTSEYAQQGWYIDVGVLEQATAFKMNNHMLQFMQSYGDYHALPRPDGISDYNGGYIKTEFLSQGDVTYVEPAEPTEEELQQQWEAYVKTACEGSGGTYDNGACACPDGYYLNGTVCEVAEENTDENGSDHDQNTDHDNDHTQGDDQTQDPGNSGGSGGNDQTGGSDTNPDQGNDPNNPFYPFGIVGSWLTPFIDPLIRLFH